MNSRHIEISIDDQTLVLFDGRHEVAGWTISSAARGVGFILDSYRTPTGRFRIAEKIGADAPAGTRFRGRVPRGLWNGEKEAGDLVLSRILWLDGLEPHNSNSRARFIYIHGTNHEDALGQPASQGCIRMSNADVIDLFEMVEPGTPVVIHPPTRKRGKLIFFDCDSTLSSIEGIDELARARGPEVFAEVEALTHAAMNGEIALDQVFPKRMEIIRPDKELCAEVAQQYIETETPGVRRLIDDLRDHGWTPVILSGGFARLIQPLAASLGIRHIEAVPLFFDEAGNYVGYDTDYPTTRNGGKPEIIREWKEAMLPERVVMVGDGISDLESRVECDRFVGFGGVVERDAVKAGADIWITAFDQLRPDQLEQAGGSIS